MLTCLLPCFELETSASSGAKKSLDDSNMPAEFALQCKYFKKIFL